MPYLAYASVIPVIIATAVAVIRFKRLEPALRCLAYLVVFAAVIELVSRGMVALQRPNLFLFPIDTLVEFGLLAWMYRRAFWPSAVSRGLPVVVSVFSLVSLLSYTEPANLFHFNALQRFAESFLVLGLVLLYFYKVIRELVIVHLEREPMFWVSVGLLLYFSGNVFIFVSSNYVLQHSEALSLRLWNIHALLYMALYSLYAVALWISPSIRK
ncbi:MAG TPA: hypothetical protein VF598_07875 [Hymenobacter sp.]|jgi:hypothetical protein